MGTLKARSGYSFEAVTAVLGHEEWWRAIRALISSLDASDVGEVDVEFGFVLKRDLKGLAQGRSGRLSLEDLERTVLHGLDEGTIERVGSSDFCVHVVGRRVGIMLCNEADIHIGADERAVLEALLGALRSAGIAVRGS